MAEGTNKPDTDDIDAAMADEQTAVDTVESAAQTSQSDSSAGEVRQLQDRLLRTQAELDNFRKRSRRELEDERRYAELPLLRDLLPVVDNVTRAIEAAQKNADAASLLEGFRMVSQQLGSVLERHHCKPIKALHEPFDPHLHEAIMQQPSNELPENSVLMVTQEGYQVHDRVIRPSQVIVSKKAE
ncbi:MAG TPA: nucleotide exchange factor GrpE [Burkholderiaceae bacterium]|nr:nucleotide exchange factor GrpE [Burkholderiaceae bacterium]